MATPDKASAQDGGSSGFTSPIDAALRYAEIGWPVFPVAPAPEKTPLCPHGFLEATTEREAIVSWWRRWPQAQIGVPGSTAGLCCIDLDLKPEEGLDGVAYWTRLCDENGRHGCGLIASTPRGGRHYVYLMPDPMVGTCTNVLPGSGIDVRAAGGYFIVPSPASPGREWLTGDPFAHDAGESDLCSMPEWVERLARTTRSSHHSEGSSSGRVCPLDERMVARIRSALDRVENDSRKSWLKVGMALKSTGAAEQAYELWVEWSQRTASPGVVHPKFDPEDQRKQWRSVHEYRLDGTEITIATLFFLAKEGGWIPTLDEEVAAAVEPAEPAPAKPAAAVRSFPLELMNCPGLVGEMAAWMVRSSPRPQPALCLASTLATIGALLGRRVASPSDLRSNLYCLGIGETGCGKDPSVKLPQVLFANAGLSRFIGPGEWKSDSGLRSALVAEPSHVCLMDEFTKALAAMSGRQVPPHILGIKSYLLRLFPLANGVFLAPAYADRRLNAPVEIPEPNLCVYGTGVPSELFTSLDRGAMSDGFLNRFLVFFADDQQPQRQRVSRSVPPPAIIAAVKALDVATRPAGNLQGVGSGMASSTGCRVVPHTPEANEFVLALEREVDQRVSQMRAVQDPMVDLWLRFVEHVVKVALIRTVADDPRRATAVHDLQWARELVQWCTERATAIAEDHVADSPQEALTKRVLRVITAAGARGLTGGQLTRRTQWLRLGERRDILTTLVNSGQVTMEAQVGATKPTATYVAVTEPRLELSRKLNQGSSMQAV